MDIRARLVSLKRPRLLVQAARKGLMQYHRDRDLKTVLRTSAVPRNVLARLEEEEAILEMSRTTAQATYSAVRHVAVLTALMAEARL